MQQQNTTIAKGCFQRELLNDLLSDRGMTSVSRRLRGKARRYAGRYQDSYFNMRRRMERSGFEFSYIPGPMGGNWGSKTFAKLVQK